MTARTLREFLADPKGDGNPAPRELAILMEAISDSCRTISYLVSRGALADVLGSAGTGNVQGEEQKQLDVLANDEMMAMAKASGVVAAAASEEEDDARTMTPGAPYLLLFDPLDGSSNIDVNVTVGTIFSVLKAPDGVVEPKTEDFLQPGTRQVAAGYALYGPTSMMVITLGAGVHGFTLDREIGAYTLTHPDMRIPETTREFAINASNERFWEPPVRRYVEECVQGKAGPRAADFNMRWIASLVAETHRILMRGGVFMYPRDNKDPSKPGRLRLLYEANPIGMLIEQAGGKATTGHRRILEVKPESLHQRIGFIFGSSEEVSRIEAYHAEEPLDTFKSPLFGKRGLFASTTV